MTNPKTKGVTKEEILATFADAINEKYVKGDQGDIGLEGRSPMHVQEAHPTLDVELGDLHYRPSSKKLFLFDGKSWEEIAKQGELGFEGEEGPMGPKPVAGKDYPIPKDGKDGKDAKDAVIDYKKIEKTVELPMKKHEKEFDHTLIDPFLVGSKKVNEKGMEKGMFIQYDGDELVYSTIKQVVQQVEQAIPRRGYVLPTQTSNTGKVLTSNGSQGSETWETPSAGGDMSTDAIWDAKGDLAVGTGADTATRLAAGTDAYVLTSNSATLSGLEWVALGGGGDALVGSPLSQFAATTSLQLKGVISDETGSGALVFAETPTLVTPILGTPTSGTLTNATGLLNSGVLQQALGAPTYTTLRDERNAAGSAGWISGGTISNATGGTFDVSAGTGWIRDATAATDDIFSIDWAASNSIAIADGVIYGVAVNYNAGTPVVTVTDITTPAVFVNLKTTFLLGLIMREGTTYTYKNFQTRAGDVAALTNAFASAAFSKPRANNTGLNISTDASLSLTLAAGTVFVGLNAVAHAGTSTFDEYYTSDSGTTWTRTASQTLFDETQYNNPASGLVTLSAASKWGVHWVYGNLDGTMSVVFGQAEYANEASAKASTTPTILPPKLKSQLSWLVGRILFQKSVGSAAEMESVYGTAFVGGAASNHANLTNLAWTSTGHTGTASAVAGFSGAGAASEFTTTGTGTVLALATSPSFTTPVLGVATATSINKVAFTAPATSATIVATDGTSTTLGGGSHSGTNTGDQTNITGNAATVTTNANLTGVVTSVGNATAIADTALSIAKTSGLQTALDAKIAIVLDGTPDSDHTANGHSTNTFTAGATITIMDLVYMGGASKWLLTDADAAATATGMLAISLESKTDTQAMSVALPCSFVRDDTWAWTPGATLYIDTVTPGAITATAPSGTTDIVRVVGHAVTADVIYFNPSNSWVEIA